MSDDPESETAVDATDLDATLLAASLASNYKVRGKFAGANGAGVLGYNTAGSGTPVGVQGVVDDPGGFGLETPDDARIEGDVEATSGHTLTVGGDPNLRLGPEGTDSDGDPAGGNVVCGFRNNSAGDAIGATISGGGGNLPGVGDQRNRVTDNFGTVGGGYANQAGDAQSGTDSATYATVGGGTANTASGGSATVAGGDANDASAFAATVAGGFANDVTDRWATIAGGNSNVATAQYTAIAGGFDHDALGEKSAIGGGENNRTGKSGTFKGTYATVPGGKNNVAREDYSFAAGREAKAEHAGAFVFGDGSSTQVTSGASDEVRFQAGGGFVIEDIGTGSTGTNVLWDNGELILDTSSARYKTDVRPLDADPGAAMDLEARRFEYEESGVEDVGFLAEEVVEDLPELVVRDEEGRPESVRYDRLGVFLLPAVRDLRRRLSEVEGRLDDADDDRVARLESELKRKDDRIDHQNDRIEALEAENDDLRERNAALERRLAAVESELGLSAGPEPAPGDD